MATFTTLVFVIFKMKTIVVGFIEVQLTAYTTTFGGEVWRTAKLDGTISTKNAQFPVFMKKTLGVR